MERGKNLSVETYTSISTLKRCETYEQVFLVDNINFSPTMQTKKKKAFAHVVLKDVTGTIKGVIWGYNDDIVEGQYYTMKIEVKIYNDILEFATNAEDITPVDIPLNHFDYVTGMSGSMLKSYASEVETAIMSIDDPIYRDIMGNALHGMNLLQAISQSPYGITGPMAYQGGLLVHITHSMRLALVTIQQAKELEIPFSPSLVLAGCVLRNIGWHTTTQFKGDLLRPLDSYHMLGIHRSSARFIDRLMVACERTLEIKIPMQKRQALENMCNKRPEIKTIEGKIVSCADNMADVLDFSVATLQHKQVNNWKEELFVGHIKL